MDQEQEEETKPTSVMFDHCNRVYDEMAAQAREELINGADSSEDPDNVALIYEGHLTRLFQSLGLSTPYYTSVMNHLKTMGCVEQLRRGGGNSPSRWILRHAPTEDAFNSIEGQLRASKGKFAALEQRVGDLTRTVNELYGQVQSLITLAAAQQRELERQQTVVAQQQVDIARLFKDTSIPARYTDQGIGKAPDGAQAGRYAA
jgi:hypothetical protein